MKRKCYRVRFGYGGYIDVIAFNEKEARILAAASAINAGLPYDIETCEVID